MLKIESAYIKRWITGLIIAPILLLIILFGGEKLFAAVVVMFIVGGVCEYNNMVFGKGFTIEKIESVLFAIIIPFSVLGGGCHDTAALIAFSVIIVFILFIWSIKNASFDFLSVPKLIFGIIYIPFLLSHFIALRMLDQGALWILFVLVLAFAGDIFALYAGRYFGKHKLVPFVSPGKTTEGLIGLVIGSTVASLVFGYFFLPEISMGHIAVMAFVGCIIGQLGDISESAIKRHYGFKDASSLLPGHGGILDRLDCLIFIVPFIYYYRIFVIV